MTVTVTVRVVMYSDFTGRTEKRAVGGTTEDSMGVGVDDRVLGLLID